MRVVDLRELRAGDVITDRVREHEIPIGQALHERGRAEAVRPVIGEVRLASHMQAGDGAHEVVVHPQTAHRIVHSRVDTHRPLIRILIRDTLVHVEQIAVAFGNRVLAEALDGIREIQIHAQPARADTATIITGFLGGTRRNISRRQVAEARILPLQEVIALRFRDGGRCAIVPPLDRHPHASVVAKRFRHERELRLMVAAHRNAGGVDLRVARVGERRALLVRTPRGRRVRQHGVRAEVEHVAIPARGKHHGIGRVRRDLAGEQIARHDPARMPVDDDHVEHLFERVHLHALEGNLALKRRIRTEQQLLTGLSTRVERARDLRAAERPVGQ